MSEISKTFCVDLKQLLYRIQIPTLLKQASNPSNPAPGNEAPRTHNESGR